MLLNTPLLRWPVRVAALGFLSAQPLLAHVTLIAPNGGEQLQVGSTFTIQWENTVLHNLVDWDLWYSVTGPGGPWIPIALNLPPGNPVNGSIIDYTWVVPDNISSTVRVRVRQDNVGTDYLDISDSNLAITPALGTSYCGPAMPNSTGQPGVVFAWGSSVVADQDFHLTAAQLPPNQFGYFLNSQTQGLIQNPGGSQGNLCLGGSIGRHVSQTANSGGEGVLVIDIDLTQLPRPAAPQAVLAGETWRFQAWYRQGNTSNFTDGVAVTFS